MIEQLSLPSEVSLYVLLTPIVLPTPGFTVVIVMARDYEPVLLGVVAGVGATFGELSGSAVGYFGRQTIEGVRSGRLIHRATPTSAVE